MTIGALEPVTVRYKLRPKVKFLCDDSNDCSRTAIKSDPLQISKWERFLRSVTEATLIADRSAIN